MTTPTLDGQGRIAAEALHRAAATVDTEAALVRTMDATSSSRARMARLRRPLAIAAAIALMVGGLTVGIRTFGSDHDGGRPLETADAPFDPAAFGPVLGTISGFTNPDLRAELRGPRPLRDGSQMAVIVTGAKPGRTYSASECRTATPALNPAGSCIGVGSGATADRNGRAVLVASVWRVFTSGGFGTLNDCLATPCRIEVHPVVEDPDPNDPQHVEQFSDPSDGSMPQRSTFALEFDDDPVIVPTVTAQVLRREPERTTVRLRGNALQPGPHSVTVDGTYRERTGFLADASGEAQRGVGEVQVSADGTLDAEVTLPRVIELDPELGSSSHDGVEDPPAVVNCDDPGASCRLTVHPSGDLEGRSRHLRPGPIPYPE